MKKKIDLKGELDKFRVIFGDFNISLSVIDRKTEQKIITYIQDLNNAINNLT